MNSGNQKLEKLFCKTCGLEFYRAPSRRAKYCCAECQYGDPTRKEEWRNNIKRSDLSCGPWAKGKTKDNDNDNDERISALSKTNSSIIQKMYDDGKIDLTKRKTDYKALGQKVSNTISRKLADGTLKNQYRFRKGWYVRRDGTREFYESSYEKRYMEMMDEKGMTWTKRHGIRIHYLDPNTNTMRYYIPDFLVNSIELHEVKPSRRVNEPKVLAKTNSAERYCLTNQMTYKIITEKDLGL